VRERSAGRGRGAEGDPGAREAGPSALPGLWGVCELTASVGHLTGEGEKCGRRGPWSGKDDF